MAFTLTDLEDVDVEAILAGLNRLAAASPRIAHRIDDLSDRIEGQAAEQGYDQ